MATLFDLPPKSIRVYINSVSPLESANWYNPLNYSNNSSPILRDYTWQINADVYEQFHSSIYTRIPGLYNGQDIAVGQWIANISTGQSWEIISINSSLSTNSTFTVRDTLQYNTLNDYTQTGNGTPLTGSYIIFELNGNNPIIDSTLYTTSSDFYSNIVTKFSFIDNINNYSLYQENNNFQIGDIISVNPDTNSFQITNEDTNQVLGTITSISNLSIGWFTINLIQKVLEFNYLPGDIGDTLYINPADINGPLVTQPSGKSIYLKLRNNTNSIAYSSLPGPLLQNSILSLNNVNISLPINTNLSNLNTIINSYSSQTQISTSLILSPVIISNTLGISSYYGESLLWASNNPASISINGVLVTFNILSADLGYEQYARPSEMVQSINSANILNIVASLENGSLIITNTAGLSITIINLSADINGVNFAGVSSATGLPLSTSNSTTNILKFIAEDARDINFLDITGNTIFDFGLFSVESGIKAAAIYINSTENNTTVSTNVYVQPVNPNLSSAGIWIQTGLGTTGNDFTFWFEDGL